MSSDFSPTVYVTPSTTLTFILSTTLPSSSYTSLSSIFSSFIGIEDVASATEVSDDSVMVLSSLALSFSDDVSSTDSVLVCSSTEEVALSIISDVLLSALLACSLPVPAQAVIEIKSAIDVATAKNFFAFIFSYSFLK